MHTKTGYAREGELYEIIEMYGKRFEIYYGYYEDFERGKIEPIPIYPLFDEYPEYTDEGYPLATQMQNPCKQYTLRTQNIDNDRCADCIHFFAEKDNIIGICRCERKKTTTQNKEAESK